MIRRETPKPQNVAMDSTFSRFLVGADSAVTIQIRGDWTPNENSHRKMRAMAALAVVVVGTAITVVMIATMIKHAAQNAPVVIKMILRPYMSGRK